MIKYICDECGEEIEHGDIVVKTRIIHEIEVYPGKVIDEETYEQVHIRCESCAAGKKPESDVGDDDE